MKVRHQRHWTEEECQYLIDNYKSFKDINWIANNLNRSPRSVRWKIRHLGVVEFGTKAFWSEQELMLLRAWGTTKPLAILHKSWSLQAKKRGWPERTVRALSTRLSHENLSFTPPIDWYSISDLVGGLEASDKAIISWIHSGKLKAKRENGREGKGEPFLVQERDLVDFALKYPASVAERISPYGMRWLLQLIQQNIESRNFKLGNKKCG